MNVASLFTKLGLQIDEAAWAKGDARLAAMQAKAGAAVAGIEGITRDAQGRLRHANGKFVAEGSAAMKAWEEANLDGAERTKRAWGRTFESIRAGFVAVGKAIAFGSIAVYGVKRVTDLGDAYNGAASRVRQLTDDTERQTRINNALFASAQNTGTLFTDVAQVYQQVGKAAVDSGRSLEAGVKIVDTINKALKASGATSEGGTQALRQLSQALGSGTLRGEEFNSVIEQAPYLIDIIAKSMGKTRGEMRKMAEAGAITSKQILKALEGQADAVDAAYNKRIPQAGEAWTRMRNTVEKSIGTLLQNKEVMDGLQAAIAALTAILVGAITVFGKVAAFFAKHTTLTKVLTAAVLALAAAYVTLRTAQAAAALGSLLTGGALRGVGAAAAGSAGVLGRLGAIAGGSFARVAAAAGLATGPIGLVAAGVVAAGVAAYTFRDEIVGAFSAAGRAASSLWRRLRGISSESVTELGRIGNMAQGKEPMFLGPDATRYTPHVDTAGRAKWDRKAPDPWLMPTRRVPKPSRSIVISGNTTTIQVNSPATDPEQVAALVDKKNREFWDNQMRDAAAAAGGEDDEA